MIVTQPVKKGATGVVVQVVINPEVCPRMGVLGKAFQRIRYHRMRFEVVAGWPSTVAGAYVAGFVKDATDPVPAASATSTLLASGGTATKFWQSCNVNVAGLPDLYYTSSDPEEKRWASPGSFVLSVVGPPSADASFEVFVHWDVSFYEPTYEAGVQDAGFSTALTDLYTSTGNKYLSKRDGSSWKPATWADFSPPLFEGALLTVLSMRSASVQNSSKVLSGVYNFRQLKCTGSVIYPVDDKGKLSDQEFFDECYVVFNGEKVELSKPPNSTVASWFRSALRRHQRLGLSESLRSDPSSSLENPSETMPSSSTPCISEPRPSNTTQPSRECIAYFARLQRALDRGQFSPETLSRLMESLMVSPPLSRASSQTSCDGFQLL